MFKMADVIKYEGDNSTFVWKHPCEDFNTTTQLIVHESQQAIFYMNGQLLDVFEAGRHTLKTENIPLIRKFFNLPYGGETPFHCEIYFVNKTEQMAIKWGTDSQIEYLEPTYNFPIKIGASGEMSLRVIDSAKLLIKIVGTDNNLTQASIIQKFRAFLMTKFKTYMSTYIRENSINIFQIDEKLSELSENMQKLLIKDFEEYGVSLVRFFITTIIKPEEDSTFKRYKDLYFRQYADITEAKLKQNVDIINQETEKQKMILEAEGIARKRKIEGYTYSQERSFDVAEGFAKNESGNNMANLGIGLGVMAGVGETVGGIVNSGIKNIEQIERCPECGNELPSDAKFCHNCGKKIEKIGENEIICPHCKQKTKKGKFCSECGKKLIIVCSNCNKEISSNTKFCPECGHRLEENSNG